MPTEISITNGSPTASEATRRSDRSDPQTQTSWRHIDARKDTSDTVQTRTESATSAAGLLLSRIDCGLSNVE